MRKTIIMSAIAVAIASSSSISGASVPDNMEECKVVDKNGKGLIKPHKGACDGGKSSCAGTNLAGDPTAFIIVPKGQCIKINEGDFSDVSADVKDMIEGASK